jgi:phosphoserine aminotransferase
MSRVYNFSAGPAVLPEEVLQQAAAEILDWHGSGSSIMEMSHRGKEFIEVAQQSEKDLRELLNIPANYKVLFLQGGATLQFAMIPVNLLRGKTTADYINTGSWSQKAISEAKRYCKVNVAATSEAQKFTTIPDFKTWKLDPDAAYVHYCANETIGGVEFHWTPDTGKVPLVSDMSSTLLSRPIDVSKFGLIYAGAQKNIGPAGLVVLIVREDLIGQTLSPSPSLFDYKAQVENESMVNTPATYSWYLAGLVFQWLKKKGGLAEMAKINQRKAGKLYQAIEGSGGFYKNPVDPACRSWMNIPFTLPDEKLDEVFLKEAKKHGLATLKGHRSVGGMRASIYNAMPEAGVDKLISFMQEFQRTHG